MQNLLQWSTDPPPIVCLLLPVALPGCMAWPLGTSLGAEGRSTEDIFQQDILPRLQQHPDLFPQAA